MVCGYIHTCTYCVCVHMVCMYVQVYLRILKPCSQYTQLEQNRWCDVPHSSLFRCELHASTTHRAARYVYCEPGLSRVSINTVTAVHYDLISLLPPPFLSCDEFRNFKMWILWFLIDLSDGVLKSTLLWLEKIITCYLRTCMLRTCMLRTCMLRTCMQLKLHVCITHS